MTHLKLHRVICPTWADVHVLRTTWNSTHHLTSPFPFALLCVASKDPSSEKSGVCKEPHNSCKTRAERGTAVNICPKTRAACVNRQVLLPYWLEQGHTGSQQPSACAATKRPNWSINAEVNSKSINVTKALSAKDKCPWSIHTIVPPSVYRLNTSHLLFFYHFHSQ